MTKNIRNEEKSNINTSIVKKNSVSSFGSYSTEDVIFLLKDITNAIEERGTEDREEAIQSGVHYSEMLPVEYEPSEEYMKLFYGSLEESAFKLATAVGVVVERIIENRGKNIVLVSLARAGTPVGILIKRYLDFKYEINAPHYSVSIIRGKGLDLNAIQYILRHHANGSLQFIDGWTGKGAITKVLAEACEELKDKHEIYLDDDLAVLADPGSCVNTYGTREDFLIPSACLNATVSGLISRTVHREDLIGPHDFHGAKYYRELAHKDVSNLFIERIVAQFPYIEKAVEKQVEEIGDTKSPPTWEGWKAVEALQKEYGIDDVNLIKPGIGETTRVLLRRVPWKILVKDRHHPNLKHILLLAKDRNVEVEEYPEMIYQCCGIIKSV